MAPNYHLTIHQSSPGSFASHHLLQLPQVSWHTKRHVTPYSHTAIPAHQKESWTTLASQNLRSPNVGNQKITIFQRLLLQQIGIQENPVLTAEVWLKIRKITRKLCKKMVAGFMCPAWDEFGRFLKFKVWKFLQFFTLQASIESKVINKILRTNQN